MDDKYSLKTIQHFEFEILKYIRDVCDRNGLRYYLAYGTLIGAVRHQGFIPWDDDIDIHMPREDYEKFVDLVTADPHPYYRLISGETEPKFTHILAKVIDSRTQLTQIARWRDGVQLGLYVDIFVLDGAGNSQDEAEEIYRKAFSLFYQWRRSVKTMFEPEERYPDANQFVNFLRWLYHTPQRLLGHGYWRRKHVAYCLERHYDECEWVGAMAAGTGRASRNVWKREWFGDGTDVSFQGETFRAPANWDAVLRPEYGDYMELPPAEKRHSKHPFILEIPDELLAGVPGSGPDDEEGQQDG